MISIGLENLPWDLAARPKPHSQQRREPKPSATRSPPGAGPAAGFEGFRTTFAPGSQRNGRPRV